MIFGVYCLREELLLRLFLRAFGAYPFDDKVGGMPYVTVGKRKLYVDMGGKTIGLVASLTIEMVVKMIDVAMAVVVAETKFL